MWTPHWRPQSQVFFLLVSTKSKIRNSLHVLKQIIFIILPFKIQFHILLVFSPNFNNLSHIKVVSTNEGYKFQGWLWLENKITESKIPEITFKWLMFYLFWLCPVTFENFCPQENSWNQLNNWQKSSLMVAVFTNTKDRRSGRQMLF